MTTTGDQGSTSRDLPIRRIRPVSRDAIPEAPTAVPVPDPDPINRRAMGTIFTPEIVEKLKKGVVASVCDCNPPETLRMILKEETSW